MSNVPRNSVSGQFRDSENRGTYETTSLIMYEEDLLNRLAEHWEK